MLDVTISGFERRGLVNLLAESGWVEMSGRVVAASTDDVPRERRARYWEEVIAGVHLPLEIETPQDSDFSASVVAIALADINLLQITCTAHIGRCGRLTKDEQGLERCLFVAAQRGQIVLRQGEREIELGPGDMALTESHTAMEYSVADHVTLLCMSFPSNDLMQRLGRSERAMAAVLSHGTPLHRFTYHYLERLFTFAPTIEPQELFRLKNHALDLVTIAIGRLLTSESAASSYKGALLRRMKGFVEENLHEPKLDIAMVAGHFRVTSRYVSQLFRDDLTTFNTFVRDRRLERCRRLLELSTPSGPSIGEISASVGFGSQAYLSKVFKRAFGTTPGDYRRHFHRGGASKRG